MDLTDNLNKSVFIKVLNNFLGFVQEKVSFLTKDSVFVKNLDISINIFAVLTFVASTFWDSEKLGIIMLGGFALLVLKYLIKPNAKIEIDSFDMWVIVYVLLFCLATAWSSWFTDSIHGLIKTFIYFFGYMTFKDIFKNKPQLRIYYIALVAVLSSIQGFIGIYQNLFHVDALAGWQDYENINPEQIMTRVFGTLKPLNPNLLAGYLIATMPTILGCAFYNFKKIKFNAAAGICLFTTLLTIVFTGCRGSYIAMTMQMAVFTAISGHIIWHDFEDKPYLKKIWSGAIIAGILGALALILSQASIQKRIASIFEPRGDSSNSFRMNVYQASFKMFLGNFLTGIGVGNWAFREVYGLYMRTAFDALGAYCVPLEIAVETGIFGLINFIGFITTSIISAVKKITSNISYNEKIIISVTLISIIGMMFHGMVDTVWFRPQIQFVFWLMIAILSTSSNEVQE
jgi:putative inorganic carbon (HCO3(-)) transporter